MMGCVCGWSALGVKLGVGCMVDVSDNSKAGWRRVEVLTGPGRRRRWSAEDKARIVAEAERPGAVVSEVARRWDIRPQQLFDWRREKRRERLSGGRLTEPAFVPILPMSPMASAEPARGECRGGPVVEVTLLGARVRVAPNTDAALVAMVLRAVRASAG